MKNRLVAVLLAFAAVFGFLAVGAGTSGEASAAVVRDTGSRVFVVFTKAETKHLARSGIAGIADHPAVVSSYYVSPDAKSRDAKLVYVRGRGYVHLTTANRLVREAAAHNGNVWISYNKTRPRPFTLWTRW